MISMSPVMRSRWNSSRTRYLQVNPTLTLIKAMVSGETDFRQFLPPAVVKVAEVGQDWRPIFMSGMASNRVYWTDFTQDAPAPLPKRMTRDIRCDIFDGVSVRVSNSKQHQERGFGLFPWAAHMWFTLQEIPGLHIDPICLGFDDGVEIPEEMAQKILKHFAESEWDVPLPASKRRWVIPSKVDPRRRGLVLSLEDGKCYLNFYNEDL